MSKKFGGAGDATDNMSHTRFMLGKQGYTRASTLPRPCTDTHMHARTRTLSYTRTNTRQKYVILISFPQQQLFRERASLLLCTYIACLIVEY